METIGLMSTLAYTTIRPSHRGVLARATRVLRALVLIVGVLSVFRIGSLFAANATANHGAVASVMVERVEANTPTARQANDRHSTASDSIDVSDGEDIEDDGDDDADLDPVAITDPPMATMHVASVASQPWFDTARCRAHGHRRAMRRPPRVA